MTAPIVARIAAHQSKVDAFACAVFLSAVLVVCSLGRVGASEPLYLMFPYDYLGLADAQRRHYLIGVVDAVLTANIGKPRHEQLSRCLTGRGMDALLRVVEGEIIPQPNLGGVPMTFVVRAGLDRFCPPT